MIDLCDFYSSYGSYHHNFVNKLLHLFCIPIILATLQCMLLYNNIQFYYEDSLFSINIAVLFTSALILLYIAVDLTSGFISGVLYGCTMLAMNYLYYVQFKDQRDVLWTPILYLHIASWLLQFIGHGVFEKRTPALVDNLLLTLVAPDFVILEVMFELGYKNDVYKKAVAKIEKNIAEFRQKKNLKKKD